MWNLGRKLASSSGRGPHISGPTSGLSLHKRHVCTPLGCSSTFIDDGNQRRVSFFRWLTEERNESSRVCGRVAGGSWCNGFGGRFTGRERADSRCGSGFGGTAGPFFGRVPVGSGDGGISGRRRVGRRRYRRIDL